MSNAARPLLPARTSSGDNASSGHSRPPRQKRTLIESACSACRRRKSRCDGVRPSCSRCQNLRTDCQYEAEEGESRWSALRRRNQILESREANMRELLSFVQTRPELEALDIFHRIRASNYDDLFLLLRHIRDGSLSVPPTVGLPPPMPGSPGVDHRLPPIQTILDAPSRQMVPQAHLQHKPSLSSDESRGSVSDMGSVPPPAIHPHLRNHTHLNTLEPSLQQHPPPLVGHLSSLSSEDSTGSLSSTSGDPPQVYANPRVEDLVV